MLHQEFLDQPADELLELLWSLREEGKESLDDLLLGTREPATQETLDRLVAERLVFREGNRLVLTADGEARGRAVVRRHRLTERLLADVLDRPLDESEHAACLMEHILSPALTDAVCSFLGHPPTCPHGLPIPRGACCEGRRHEVTPAVCPLESIEPGGRAKIVFMTPGFQRRLSRLESFGVIPGTVLWLRQKQPSFVVEIEGTTLALEREVAREIYVKRVD